MNIPVWLAERLAGPATVEPADGTPRGIGTVREVTPTDVGLQAAADGATLSVTFLSDSIIEVRISSPNDLELPSFSRLESPLYAPPAHVAMAESDAGWSCTSAALNLQLGREGFRLAASTPDGTPLFCDDDRIGVSLTSRGWRAHWQLEAGDRFYGLGAKTGPLEHRGRRTALWNRDALVGEYTDPMYSSFPFFLVARHSRWIGVLLDSASRTVFDFGHSAPGRISFGPRLGALVYVVFAGPTLRDVLSQYTALTGRMPMPPRWSLGHHQSRYSYNDAEEVREIAAEFRRHDIPSDAIHLDIHYMNGFRVFTFNSTRFPHPRQLASDLERDGFRFVTIVDPGVKSDKRYEICRQGNERGYFLRGRHGARFTMKVWPGNSFFPDFCRAEVRQWWGECHRVYTDAGVAGIWNDMNEPAGWKRAWYVGDGVIPLGLRDLRGAMHSFDDGREVPHEAVHNAYGHLENQATFEGLTALRPNERPFVLTRSAFAGTQRYAAQWTGDVISSWPALRQSLPMLLGLGLSGQTFAGSDIGGFVSDSNPELYARWIQIGALAPFCRSHTSLYTHRQEPWSFGPRVEAVARAALKLRYQLLPYLYTCFWEASQTGMPVWRPLFAEFPDDEKSFEVQDQVMIGPALLAAPVLEEGATSRRVILPHGRWFDWHTSQLIDGGTAVTVDAPLERMPLFVRANAAIPTQPEVRFADDHPEHPLIWEIFLTPDAAGEIGRVYEDDGQSLDYQNGAFRVARVTASDAHLHFRAEGAYVSPRRNALVRCYGPGVKPAIVDGRTVDSSGAVELPHDTAEHVLSLDWNRGGDA